MDLVGLKKTIDNLERDVKKHYISHGIPYDKMKKVIFNMRWAQSHFTVDKWRQNRMYKLAEEFIQILEKDTPEVSLHEEINTIYDYLNEDVSYACGSGERKYIKAVQEDC